MLIMDTDHLSIMDTDTPAAVNLSRRLETVPLEEVGVTIITYEEQRRGWLSYIAGANTPTRQVEAYRRLRLFLEQYRDILLVDYGNDAASQFGAVLLTRNLKDFSQVPGLHAEDWST